MEALVPVGVVASVLGASTRTPWPTAVSSDNSTDTEVTEELWPVPWGSGEADPDDDPDGGELIGTGAQVQGSVEERL